jgi:hypothetical protein
VAIEALASGVLLGRLEAHRQQLGGQGVNLFRTALTKSKSGLFDTFIRPNLITPDRSYIYIAEDNGGKGSRPNYDPGNTLVATTVSADDNLALPGVWGLFTNPLRWTGIDAKGPRPSDRAINIGFCVYTLEFDRLSLGEQLQFIWGAFIFILSLTSDIGITISPSLVIVAIRIAGSPISRTPSSERLTRIGGT